MALLQIIRQHSVQFNLKTAQQTETYDLIYDFAICTNVRLVQSAERRTKQFFKLSTL